MTRLVLYRFVSYCMGRVELMRAAGVTPVIVFDGGRLPMKAGEEESRGRFVIADGHDAELYMSIKHKSAARCMLPCMMQRSE